MQADFSTPADSKFMLWTGYVVSAVPVLMLLFSGVMKLAKPAPVVEEFARLGYPESVILGIGITEIICALIYAIPRTSVLGAILLTGYLGGAVATHVRAGDGVVNFVGPILGGVLVWAGLYLRDERIRALVPLRR